MIRIIKQEDCCGCTSCAERCPQKCITMVSDYQGFLYPHIDTLNCIDCGLCERVCPIINTNSPIYPIKVLAAYHKDESIRKDSSSGGVFTAIAEDIIKDGGVVFGARFDNHWRVVHSFTETVDGLSAFRGSKYVQSFIGNSYFEAEAFLKQGRKVLFTGTPCQIAGLKHFLRKDYDNLYAVDFICHGVPSPLVWEKYVSTLNSKNRFALSATKDPITQLSFRDKRAGWRKYSFSAWKQGKANSNKKTSSKDKKRFLFEIQQQNIYLRGFLQNLFLRPSCFHCQFRSFKSGSDITIADYWGVQHLFPELDDDKGLSLVIQKSKPDFESYLAHLCVKIIKPENYNDSFKGNISLFSDEIPSPQRESFWDSLLVTQSSVSSTIVSHTTYSRITRIRDRVDKVLLNIGLYNTIKWIVRRLRK